MKKMKQDRRPARAASSLRASVIAVLAAFALAAPWPGEPGAAQAGVGDLLVSPVRVVLEGRERSAQVTLINKGNDVAVYRISLVNRRMSDRMFSRVVYFLTFLLGWYVIGDGLLKLAAVLGALREGTRQAA